MSYCSVLILTPPEELPMNSIKKFLRNESGIAVTEYGLLIALVAIALIAVVLVFGSDLAVWFGTKTAAITTN
jgi:Flp pilus assembly pilin Flp